MNPSSSLFQTIEDEVVLKILNSLCDVLKISFKTLGELFGDYWVNVYSQRMYKSYYQMCKNAREFLLMMDKVHVDSTKTMEEANPPRFEYIWKDKNALVMKYKSHRKLLNFMVGLIKGVGKFYREKLQVRILSPDAVEIKFE